MQTQTKPSRSNAATRGERALAGWGSLCAATALIVLVWMVVLPSLAEHPDLKARIRFLDERGIDPAAMFYTELDCLEDVLDRLDHYHRKHAGALWIPEAAMGAVSAAERPPAK